MTDLVELLKDLKNVSEVGLEKVADETENVAKKMEFLENILQSVSGGISDLVKNTEGGVATTKSSKIPGSEQDKVKERENKRKEKSKTSNKSIITALVDMKNSIVKPLKGISRRLSITNFFGVLGLIGDFIVSPRWGTLKVLLGMGGGLLLGSLNTVTMAIIGLTKLPFKLLSGMITSFAGVIGSIIAFFKGPSLKALASVGAKFLKFGVITTVFVVAVETFVNAWEDITIGFQELMNGNILKGLQTIFVGGEAGKLGGLVGGFLDAFQFIFDAINWVVRKITGYDLNLNLKETALAYFNAWESVIDGITSAVSGIIPTMAQIKDAVPSSTEEIKRTLGRALTGIQEWFGRNIFRMEGENPILFGYTLPSVSTMFANSVQEIDNIAGWGKKVFNKIGMWFSDNIWDGNWKIFGYDLSDVSLDLPSLDGVVGRISQWFQGIRDTLDMKLPELPDLTIELPTRAEMIEVIKSAVIGPMNMIADFLAEWLPSWVTDREPIRGFIDSYSTTALKQREEDSQVQTDKKQRVGAELSTKAREAAPISSMKGGGTTILAPNNSKTIVQGGSTVNQSSTSVNMQGRSGTNLRDMIAYG